MLSTVHISYGLYKLLIDSDWIDFKWIILFHISKQNKKIPENHAPCIIL